MDVEIKEPETAPVESAATDALVEVAKEAIDETASRIETLTRATADMMAFRGELEGLREAFRAHVEGNQIDFISVREKLETLELGVHIMQEALEETATIVDEVAEEVEEGAEVIVEHDAASVVDAERIEGEPLTNEEPQVHVEEADTRKHRHFVRI